MNNSSNFKICESSIRVLLLYQHWPVVCIGPSVVLYSFYSKHSVLKWRNYKFLPNCTYLISYLPKETQYIVILIIVSLVPCCEKNSFRVNFLCFSVLTYVLLKLTVHLFLSLSILTFKVLRSTPKEWLEIILNGVSDATIVIFLNMYMPLSISEALIKYTITKWHENPDKRGEDLEAEFSNQI